MTTSWTTEPVFALIFVGRENHEVQSRRRRDSNPRPSDQGANALPLDHEPPCCPLADACKEGCCVTSRERMEYC